MVSCMFGTKVPIKVKLLEYTTLLFIQMPHWGCWTSMWPFLCIYIFVSQKSLGLSLAIKLSPGQLESCIADSMYCLFVFCLLPFLPFAFSTFSLPILFTLFVFTFFLFFLFPTALTFFSFFTFLTEFHLIFFA